jgi:HK97 family phage portal protein
MSWLGDWLTGKDLQARNYIPPIEAKGAPLGPAPIFLPNPIALGTLVHGPGATEALRAAYGDGYALNSAVYACIQAIQRTYTEAPVRAFQMGADMKAEPVQPFAAVELLNRPNPNMTGNLLWAYTQYCKAVYGNAYWRKIRGAQGQVVQLWPLSPSVCWPIRRRNSTNFIDAYVYQFGSGEDGKEEIPPEDIVHFRWGLDDRDHKYGLSPLRLLVREADTDIQTTAFSDRLVRNNAVPGLVVTVPVEAGDIGKDTAQKMKADLSGAFGGENQGSTAILGGGATAAQFGFNPQQLDLTGLHRIPEERISAVLGVPAIIAGLGAGLDRATYANFKEAREMFIESTIIPAYADDDAVLNEQLLIDFTNDPAMYLAHDVTDMRALQPDEDMRYARLTLAVGGPWLTPNEARTEVGWPKDPDPAMEEVGGSKAPPPDLTPAADPNAPTPIRAARSMKALNPPLFEHMLRALAAGQEGPLEAALQTYQAGLKRRVLQRLEEGA